MPQPVSGMAQLWNAILDITLLLQYRRDLAGHAGGGGRWGWCCSPVPPALLGRTTPTSLAKGNAMSPSALMTTLPSLWVTPSSAHPPCSPQNLGARLSALAHSPLRAKTGVQRVISAISPTKIPNCCQTQLLVRWREFNFVVVNAVSLKISLCSWTKACNWRNSSF